MQNDRKKSCKRKPSAVPEGYILESPGEREDIVLSHADFHALEKLLEQKETWEQVVGLTCFGGATWQLRPTVQS
ncbi:hypothetical protein LNY74_05815 [Klebsiella pneumoniae]|nr:hypothetical protein [Klebsiella pneumoniae]MTW92432.1 hypothetical protein [Klebsiella pneumoniae]